MCLDEIVYRYLLGLFDTYCLLTSLFLFIFCLDHLLNGEVGVLKSPTINVWGSMCDLSFSNVSFTNVGALVFGVYMFRVEIEYEASCILPCLF